MQMLPNAATVDLNAYDAELVERARLYRDGVLEGYSEDSIRYEYPVGPAVIPDLDESLWPYGTVDVVATLKRRAVVIDYKFGPNPLDEEIVGPQQIAYALCIFRTFPRVNHVTVRVYHATHDIEYSATIKWDDVTTLSRRIGQIIRQAEVEYPLLVPAHNTCCYCAGRLQCPAALTELRRFDGEEKLPAIEDMTPTERGALYAKAKIAEKMVETLKKAIHELEREHPGSIEGWRLRKNQRRTINETQTAFKMLEAIGVDTQTLYGCCRILIGKAENAWCRAYSHREQVTLRQAKEEFATTFESLVELDKPSYWLVRNPKRKELESGETPTDSQDSRDGEDGDG